MAPAVRLRHAVALLGSFPALAGVDLEIERGDTVLLRGPNGAGKTTLLRVLAGLTAVTGGTAEVLGHDLVHERRAVRAHAWLVGHHTALYDDLTVGENVGFWSGAGRRAGATGAGAADRVEAALGHLGLDGRLRHVTVARLSAGQRRRTALAVLVARRPELWLLDEPHAALDAAHRDVLDALIVDAARAGATVVMASHEDDRAADLANRTVTLVGGRVAADAASPPAGAAVVTPVAPAGGPLGVA